MIDCNYCKKYFSPVTKTERFSIFDKYYIEIPYSELDSNRNEYIYPLFNELIDDIRKDDNINRFQELKYYINEHNIEYKCPHCNKNVKRDYYFSLPDEFFLYIEQYINFALDNISIKYTGSPVKDFGIDTLDINQLEGVLNSLPQDYYETKKLLLKLFKIKNVLPTLGGRGGGLEIIEWIIKQVSSGLFGIILSILITSGVHGVVGKIKNIKIKKMIRKRITHNSKFWNDISFEYIEKYIEVPEDYTESKEKLIEEIITSKINDYKMKLIEKLREDKNAT